MTKDLTSSRIDRQNILNNEIAIEEIQEKSGVEGVLWNGKRFVTREMTANFFEVDIRTISRYIEQNNDELTTNGYEVLKGKKLKSFLETAKLLGRDINVPTKITVLGVFDFRAFLNLAMLIAESGLADTTAGYDLSNNTAMPSNHLLIIPVADGRGVKATSDAIVMVKGGYTVQ